MRPEDQSSTLMHRTTATTFGSQKKRKECDFYRSPTLLSRLILLKQYAAAVRRVMTPEGLQEAAVWCVSKRENNNNNDKDDPPPHSNTHHYYSVRQLPIHMACRGLSHRYHEFSSSTPSNTDDDEDPTLIKLMGHLIVAYPEGCKQPDHQGRYPLHEAIWYGAPTHLIASLLIAAPTIVHQPDLYGRYPMELNERRQMILMSKNKKDKQDDYRDQVLQLLRKDKEYWDLARQEYRYRMKHRIILSVNDNDDASIPSMAPLASDTVVFPSQDEDDTTTSTLHDDSLRHYSSDSNHHRAILESLEQERAYWDHARSQFDRQGGCSSQDPDSLSLASRPSLAADHPRASMSSFRLKKSKEKNTVVEPMEWKQLEARAIDLEEQLARALEQTYQQAKVIADLQNGKDESALLQTKTLQKEIHSLQKQVSILEEEKRKRKQGSSFLEDLEWMNEWRRENVDLQKERDRLLRDNQDLSLRLAFLEGKKTNINSTMNTTQSSSVLEDESPSELVDEDDTDVVSFQKEDVTSSEVDSVIAHAIQLNGGQSLSRETLQAWAALDQEEESSFADAISESLEGGEHHQMQDDWTTILEETAAKYAH